jgi:hypothetical protein
VVKAAWDPNVAKRRKTPRDRIDIRAEPAWVARIQAQADRRGMSISSYIRQAVTKEVEADEATQPRKTEERK